MKKFIITMLLSAFLPIAALSESNMLYITANGITMSATLVENSSTAALKELLADAPLTIEMQDYGNFEKVGSLGHTLPRNDEEISTTAGDLILYLGSSFVIYYDQNQWNFTRLGKIDGNPTREYLLSVLGSGSVNVTLSLSNSEAGINQIEATKKLSVNVSGHTITIPGKEPNAKVRVTDLKGSEIYIGSSNRLELPGSGIYIISCGDYKAKFLVQ